MSRKIIPVVSLLLLLSVLSACSDDDSPAWITITGDTFAVADGTPATPYTILSNGFIISNQSLYGWGDIGLLGINGNFYQDRLMIEIDIRFGGFNFAGAAITAGDGSGHAFALGSGGVSFISLAAGFNGTTPPVGETPTGTVSQYETNRIVIDFTRSSGLFTASRYAMDHTLMGQFSTNIITNVAATMTNIIIFAQDGETNLTATSHMFDNLRILKYE